MAILKTRVSGAWVDTNASGAVRLSGSTITYGPSGPPAYEAIDWITTPALTNADDGSTAVYNMGCKFISTAARPCYGVRWRVPDSIITPPGGSTYASLYRFSPLAQLSKLAFTPVPGGDQDIMFSSPVSLFAGEVYIVAVFTVKYSFRSAGSVGGFPFVSPSGNVEASVGVLDGSGNSDECPVSHFDSIYYISPLVGT